MTLNNLYRKVLEELREVGAEDPAEASDIQAVAARYPSLYDLLSGENVVAWGPESEIPSYAEVPVIWMLAQLCAGPFGQDPARYAERAQSGMQMLRRQIARKFLYTPLRTTYF